MKLTKAERLVVEGRRVKMMCEERAVFCGQNGVVLDWVRATGHQDRLFYCRSSYASLSASELARAIAGELAKLLGFAVGDERNGREYYGVTVLVVNDDGVEVGYVSTGNEARQRGTFCVSVSGLGCTFGNHDWERRLYDWLTELEGKLTRVDLALDFFNGEFTLDEAKEVYSAGGFSFQNRKPTPGFQGDWINGQKRTFSVGLRESGKLCRVYEKGHKYGDLEDKWVRVEVELHNTERVLPLRMLLEPAVFFAGCYEVCELLLARHLLIPERIPLDRAVGDRTGEALVRWVENTAAPAIAAITRAVGSTSWIDDLVWLNKDRPLPKAIRGAGLEAASEGIHKGLAKSIGNSYSEGSSVLCSTSPNDGEVSY